MNQIHPRLPEWNEQPEPASGPYADLARRILQGVRDRLTRRHTDPPAGVREPRRPKAAPPAATVSRDDH
jgi:hypothetical protein